MERNTFNKLLSELNININEETFEKLEKYYDILISENEKYNLTGITDRNEVYIKHFYDSLTLVKAINLNEELSICDIGSGAGFPGIVLKIVFPNLNITLMDSTNKRCEFLKMVIKELNLENITVICDRAEEFSTKKENREKYDVVTARAVAKLDVLLEISCALIKVDGYFVAMKSNVEKELSNTKYFEKLNVSLDEVIEFKLPNECGDRTLVKIKKDEKTSLTYPRRYADIMKKSL